MLRKFARIAPLGLLALTTGCSYPRDDRVVGPYRLVAPDMRSHTVLCFTPEGDDDGVCVLDGLPGPVAFAAGGDGKYVVLARHPDGRKAVTEYYYVIRTPDERRGLRKENIVGPLDKAAFDRDSARLRLPAFTHVIDELK
jgi:hypothetical protein